jgi:hypothetical protein
MRNPKNQFESGHTGRPRGTRNRLQADFLRDLAEACAQTPPRFAPHVRTPNLRMGGCTRRMTT